VTVFCSGLKEGGRGEKRKGWKPLRRDGGRDGGRDGEDQRDLMTISSTTRVRCECECQCLPTLSTKREAEKERELEREREMERGGERERAREREKATV